MPRLQDGSILACLAARQGPLQDLQQLNMRLKQQDPEFLLRSSEENWNSPWQWLVQIEPAQPALAALLRYPTREDLQRLRLFAPISLP